MENIVWISVITILLLSFAIALFSRALFSFINNKFIGVLVSILLFISPPIFEFYFLWSVPPIEISDEYYKYLERKKSSERIQEIMNIAQEYESNKLSNPSIKLPEFSQEDKQLMADYLNTREGMSEEEKDRISGNEARLNMARQSDPTFDMMRESNQSLPFSFGDLLMPEYQKYLNDRKLSLIFYSISCFIFLFFINKTVWKT